MKNPRKAERSPKAGARTAAVPRDLWRRTPADLIAAIPLAFAAAFAVSRHLPSEEQGSSQKQQRERPGTKWKQCMKKKNK